MWRQLPSGRVQHRFEVVVLVAALALIPVLVIESDAKSSAWQNFARAANWIIWAVFLVELAHILTVAPKKFAALKAHWLDIGIVVATTPAFGSFLSSLRLARLARLLRVVRLGMLAGRALQIERRLSSVAVFRFVALVTAFVVVVAGAVESLVDKRDFHSTWDGVWFAVATVTTVGYGDLKARSVEGRVVAMLVMLRDRLPLGADGDHCLPVRRDGHGKRRDSGDALEDRGGFGRVEAAAGGTGLIGRSSEAVA